MGSINDVNGMHLTGGEGIKKRWQEIQNNYTIKLLITQITTMM